MWIHRTWCVRFYNCCYWYYKRTPPTPGWVTGALWRRRRCQYILFFRSKGKIRGMFSNCRKVFLFLPSVFKGIRKDMHFFPDGREDLWRISTFFQNSECQLGHGSQNFRWYNVKRWSKIAQIIINFHNGWLLRENKNWHLMINNYIKKQINIANTMYIYISYKCK